MIDPVSGADGIMAMTSHKNNEGPSVYDELLGADFSKMMVPEKNLVEGIQHVSENSTQKVAESSKINPLHPVSSLHAELKMGEFSLLNSFYTKGLSLVNKAVEKLTS